MKIRTTILALTLFFSAQVFSQESTQPQKKRNSYFCFGPFDLFLNTLQIGYERKLKDHNTVAINGGFRLAKEDEKIHRLGGNGEFQYRVNLLYNKEAISSVVKKYSTFAYFAPYVQYRYEEITDAVPAEGGANTQLTTVNSVFGGLGFGMRLTAIENRFFLNAYAGGGLKYADVNGDKKYADFFEVGYTGIAPKLSFQIGIAF